MLDDDEREAGKPVQQLARAEGAFLALAAGDALGWPQEMPRNTLTHSGSCSRQLEFQNWTRRSGGHYRAHEEIIRAGDYSDDTQLTLAIARSRTEHGSAWWKAFTRIELPFWLLYERGGGGATRRAAKAWERGLPPWKSTGRKDIIRYFEAGGNGVAMRVLPHALFLSGEKDPTVLICDVMRDGSATHGHPRALIGASVYAYAAWSLARMNGTLRYGELLDVLMDGASVWSAHPSRDGESTWFVAANASTKGQYERLWQRTRREMEELLAKARRGVLDGALADDHAVLKELGCFGQFKGAGTISAAAAVYLVARYAAQPVQGVLRAAFEKGADTDTLAAMTGGLMGCHSGTDWLPAYWLEVQDAQYLRSMARRIASGPEGAHESPVHPLPNPRSIFSELVHVDGSQEMDIGGAMHVKATHQPAPKSIAKSIVVRAWRLTTSDGQTMYLKKVERPAVGAHRRTDAGPDLADIQPSENGIPERPASPCRKDKLYIQFREELKSLMQPQSAMKTREIQKALGLVQSQVEKWLERAQKDGWIHQISKRPVKYELQRKSLL